MPLIFGDPSMPTTAMHPAFLPPTASALAAGQVPFRRICPWKKKRWRRRFAPRCTASPPQSAVDERGQQLPEPGQIVLTPGKWADEDGVGLVEKVRFVDSRGGYVVDVMQLRRAEEKVFEVVTRGRSKSPYNWYDVSQVRIAADAQYLEARRAYLVAEARDGYAYVEPLDEQAKFEADNEYKALKRYMLQVTGAFGAVGTLLFALAVDGDHSRAFALGALASFAYLLLLQESVNRVGDEDGWVKKALGLRFVLPALPFVVFAQADGGLGALRSGIPKTQVAAMTIGLLSYKAPVFLKTAVELVDSLAEIKPGTTGMVGTVASIAARTIRNRRDAGDDQPEGGAPAPVSTALVFAGPSGAGKSTLISMLAADFPDNIAFSVSHTTRPPRDGEQDGREYFFVDAPTFDSMVEEKQFIEHARVHDRCYGTSFASVRQVTESGKVCIIDVDVQGIEALRKEDNLDWLPRFIWVAPPSFEVLEQRLRGRSSETEETLKRRLDTARRELTYAATNSVFDLTIINDELNASYAELKSFFEAVLTENNEPNR